MKKALWLIAALVLALVLVTGCEQETLEVKFADVGTDNFNLKGETLVKTSTSYYKQIVTTTASSGDTVVTTLIPVRTTVTTVTFNKDGTWTSSAVTTNLAGIDGDYRTIDTGTVETVYCDTSNAIINATHSGRADTVTTDTASGNWIEYTWQSDVEDSRTKMYRISMETQTKQTQYYTSASTVLPADATHTAANKIVYTKGDLDTNTTHHDADDYSNLTYSYVGEQKVDGKTKDVVYLSYSDLTGTYIVQ